MKIIKVCNIFQMRLFELFSNLMLAGSLFLDYLQTFLTRFRAHTTSTVKVKAVTEFKMPTTDIRSEICNFSRKTEDVLLLLLKENEDLREGLQKEIELRENENAEIRELFTKECENLREKLDIEEKQRKNEKEYLQGQIDKLVKELSDSKEKLQSQLDQERTERIEETKQMGDYFQ